MSGFFSPFLSLQFVSHKLCVVVQFIFDGNRGAHDCRHCQLNVRRVHVFLAFIVAKPNHQEFLVKWRLEERNCDFITIVLWGFLLKTHNFAFHIENPATQKRNKRQFG